MCSVFISKKCKEIIENFLRKSEKWSSLAGNNSYKKTPKNQKLSLIPVFQSQNKTGKRWQKFHKNVIFSQGAFKILYEKWNSLLQNIILLD